MCSRFGKCFLQPTESDSQRGRGGFLPVCVWGKLTSCRHHLVKRWETGCERETDSGKDWSIHQPIRRVSNASPLYQKLGLKGASTGYKNILTPFYVSSVLLTTFCNNLKGCNSHLDSVEHDSLCHRGGMVVHGATWLYVSLIWTQIPPETTETYVIAWAFLGH